AKLLILAGADSTKVESEIEQRHLQNNVIVIDDVFDVDNYNAAADFTLYSSEYESFCLGILEGMRHGLPSVSFDVGGISEVVLDQETGYLVPFGDMEGLSQAIAKFAGDETLRKTMGEKARQRAKETFSSDTVVRIYLEAYRKVIGGPV
ncbi:MAG: glycosyltransferase, partial [Verrucomicrobia bacterium]|nr:glycosyltransferase [Verrucomicrobiota bacterium]